MDKTPNQYDMAVGPRAVEWQDNSLITYMS